MVIRQESKRSRRDRRRLGKLWLRGGRSSEKRSDCTVFFSRSMELQAYVQSREGQKESRKEETALQAE